MKIEVSNRAWTSRRVTVTGELFDEDYLKTLLFTERSWRYRLSAGRRDRKADENGTIPPPRVIVEVQGYYKVALSLTPVQALQLASHLGSSDGDLTLSLEGEGTSYEEDITLTPAQARLAAEELEYLGGVRVRRTDENQD